MTQKDRRASPRFQARPGSHIVYVEGSGAIRELSVEGVFVLDSEPLPVGATIKFSLRLATQDVALQGIVRRCVAEVGMGIQFTEMSREARRRIRLHIASQC
jgi:hypothetical protein